MRKLVFAAAAVAFAVGLSGRVALADGQAQAPDAACVTPLVSAADGLTGAHGKNVRVANNGGYNLDLPAGTLWLKLTDGCEGAISEFSFDWLNRSSALTVRFAKGPLTEVRVDQSGGHVDLALRDLAGKSYRQRLTPAPISLVGYLRTGRQDLFFNFDDRQQQKWGGVRILHLLDSPAGPRTRLDPVP